MESSNLPSRWRLELGFHDGIGFVFRNKNRPLWTPPSWCGVCPHSELLAETVALAEGVGIDVARTAICELYHYCGHWRRPGDHGPGSVVMRSHGDSYDGQVGQFCVLAVEKLVDEMCKESEIVRHTALHRMVTRLVTEIFGPGEDDILLGEELSSLPGIAMMSGWLGTDGIRNCPVAPHNETR